MARITATRIALLATTFLGGLALAGGPVRAQDAASRIGSIEAQIKTLQSQLQQVKRDLARSNAQARAAQQEAARAREEARRAPPPSPVPAPPPTRLGQAAPPPGTAGAQAAVAVPGADEKPVTYTGKLGQIRIGGVTVQLGGFVEADGIFRSSNEVADLSSSWNAIPFPNDPKYHESEIRGTARHSRFSLLVQGQPDPSQTIAAYGEADFLGAATTANSVQSDSYTPRLRQAYAQYDNTDWNLHVLAGQAWSLLTLNKAGIVPRQENIPLTINSAYLPGFTWKRQPQFRVATDFDDHKIWLAASIENPQTNFFIGPNGAGTIVGTANFNNPGGSGFAPTNNYSLDAAPDVIVKAAWDPGFGHYEAYGLARFMRTRVSTVGQGSNTTVLAGGGGAGMILPVVPKYLELQASFLAGSGIGSYGSGQLPDATLSQSGAPQPLPEIEALVGLVGHPVPAVDVYGYVGTEQIGRKAFTAGGKGFGYGSPLYSNAGCEIELSALPCVANTSGLVQGTLGAWWRFAHGSYGTAQVGAQYSYTNRSVFSGVGGAPGPDENTVMISFRYAPFQ